MRGKKKGMKISGEEKLYLKCPQCDDQHQKETFASRKLLKEHIREVHNGVGLTEDGMITGMPPRKCNELDCDFEAATQKLLIEHRRDIHGIDPVFRCRYCTDFETATRKRLAKHIAAEHETGTEDGRPYGCKRCPSTFFRYQSY